MRFPRTPPSSADARSASESRKQNPVCWLLIMLLFAVPTSAAAWAPLSAQPARPFTPAAARRAVGAAPLMQQQGLPVAPAPFNQTTAVLAAGFAFEAYNEPSEQDARWERGADGCDVAFMSEEFAREVYAGRLEVRLVQAKELSTEQDLAQTLMSGGQRDPYVIFAMNEENEQGPKEGAIGLGRAVVRSSPCAPTLCFSRTWVLARTTTRALTLRPSPSDPNLLTRVCVRVCARLCVRVCVRVRACVCGRSAGPRALVDGVEQIGG